VHLVLLLSLACLIALALLVLFEPGSPYRVVAGEDGGEAEDLPRLVAALVGSQVQRTGSVEVLTNGEAFYAGELAAIQAARSSVHIEAFLFHPSRIADRFLAALIDCAKRGVRVRVVLDAIGSFPAPDSYFDALRAAGGRLGW